MYIIKERRGVDANGKSVQALRSRLKRVSKGAGQIPQPCIVRSVAPTWERLSTFATAINGGRSFCHVKYRNKYHCKKYLDAQETLRA